MRGPTLLPWKRSNFSRSVGILASAQGIAYLLGLLSIPILARVYSPSSVGEVALITSIASVVASAASLGLQSAIVKVRCERDALLLLSVGMLLSTLFVLVGLTLALVSQVDLTRMQGRPGSISAVATLALIAGIAGLTNISSYLNYYANRRSADGVLFTNTLIGAVSTLIVSVPLGLLGAGAWGLVAGALFAVLASTGQMILRLKPKLSIPNLGRIRHVLRQHRDFVFFLYPANFLENFTAQLPRQVVSFRFGNAKMGQLSMNDRVLAIPLRLLGAPVSTVYFREASRRHNRGEDISAFTYRIVTGILYASVIPVVVAILWGDSIFSLALGDQWASAGLIAGLLAVPMVFQLIRVCVGSALVITDRQRMNLLLGVVRLTVEGGVLLLGIALQVDIFTLLGLFAVASTAFYVIDMVATLRALNAGITKYLTHSLLYGLLMALTWLAKTTILSG
ncbi:MAG: oligosaccharide flippase family protein [Yaniella sp.]|nr:oligosaccharide flippase family protein [Yaniella sp.]